jgi:hypothetical protein
LHEYCFTSSWWSNDKSALSFSDRRHQVHNAGRVVSRIVLKLQSLFGVKRRQVIEQNFVFTLFGIFEVEAIDFN